MSGFEEISVSFFKIYHNSPQFFSEDFVKLILNRNFIIYKVLSAWIIVSFLLIYKKTPLKCGTGTLTQSVSFSLLQAVTSQKQLTEY